MASAPLARPSPDSRRWRERVRRRGPGRTRRRAPGEPSNPGHGEADRGAREEGGNETPDQDDRRNADETRIVRRPASRSPAGSLVGHPRRGRERGSFHEGKLVPMRPRDNPSKVAKTEAPRPCLRVLQASIAAPAICSRLLAQKAPRQRHPTRSAGSRRRVGPEGLLRRALSEPNTPQDLPEAGFARPLPDAPGMCGVN